MITLPDDVTMIGAFRPTGDHDGVLYGPVGFVAPTREKRHAAVSRIVRQALGGVQEHHDGEYAVLDCYNDEGDLVTDFGIRDRDAFRFLYRKMQWRQEPGGSDD